MGSKRVLQQMIGLVIVVLVVTGCSGASSKPTATSTPIPPTSTPVPPTATWTPQINTPTPTLAPPATPTRQGHQGTTYMLDWGLDVQLPETADGPLLTLLFLHGAGGNDQKAMEPMASYFSQRGYATVLAHWLRGWPPDWPAESSNAFCALAWIHTNAESYGFDPGRVVVVGHSAGGYAASIIGMVDDPAGFMEDCPHQLPSSDWTAGVVTYGGLFGAKEVFLTKRLPNYTPFALLAGAFGVTPEERDEIHAALMGTEYEAWSDISGLSAEGTKLLQYLAPYWVDGSEAPVLLVQGENDFLGAAAQEAFVGQLQAAGVEASLSIIPGADHEAILDSSSPGFEEACQAIEAFLTEVVE